MRRVLVVVAVASSFAVVAPAHADPATNASFLNAVSNAGIKFSDDQSAIKAGKTVCALMDLWQPEPDVVNEVAQQNPNIGPDKAELFTVIARTTYCPQYLPPGG
jgi:hypothetical protein